MASSRDLLGVGQHCAHPNCQQIDFLPFKCDCCSKVYCLQHRSYKDHSCPFSGQKETTTIVCPICAKAIIVKAGQDPQQAFYVHQDTECDPQNYQRVHNKPKCPVKGCREKLNEINRYVCKDCGITVCLKHRYKEDHLCKGKPAQVRQTVSQKWRNFPMNATPPVASAAPSSSSQQSISEQFQSGIAKLGRLFSIRDSQPQKQQQPTQQRAQLYTNQQRSRQQQQQQQQQQQTVRNQRAGAREICPTCSKSFATVGELIRHTEQVHTQQQGGEVCPVCRQRFSDPVQLVTHFERSHPATVRG